MEAFTFIKMDLITSKTLQDILNFEETTTTTSTSTTSETAAAAESTLADTLYAEEKMEEGQGVQDTGARGQIRMQHF